MIKFGEVQNSVKALKEQVAADQLDDKVFEDRLLELVDVAEDGYYWILGRLDDVLKVSGHRIGTMEVESALVSHPSVAEAAVAPFPHKIKGQAIWAYVTLMEGVSKSDELAKELKMHVRKEIGPVFQPDAIQFADSLPKTRSGKIMRRILKAIASGTDIGNVTTLADPSVVDALLEDRKKIEV